MPPGRITKSTLIPQLAFEPTQVQKYIIFDLITKKPVATATLLTIDDPLALEYRMLQASYLTVDISVENF